MKIFESPDSILGLKWTYDDAMTFAYLGSEFFADFSITHFNLTGTSRDFLRMAGRLWVESKIISFWHYPNITELYDIIKDINDFLKTHGKKYKNSVIDDTWQIDLYQKLIPLPDYIYYLQYNELPKRSEEELKISHTDSPQEKERKRQLLKQQGKEEPKGFKSKYDIPAKFDHMRRKYIFQEKFNDFKKLNESPDRVEYKDDLLGYRHLDAVTFGYYDGEMLTGYNIMTHSEFGVISNKKTFLDRDEFLYAGRLWKNSKIISFWEYPKPEELNKVLKDIENSYHNITYTSDSNNIDDVEIKDDNIYIGGNLLVSVDFYNDEKDFEEVKNIIKNNYVYGQKLNDVYKLFYISVVFGVLNKNKKLNITDDWLIELSNGDVISIKEYTGSSERSEEELKISHTDNPQEKERKRQLLKQQGKEEPKGFKSKYDIPAKFDHMRRKYIFQENKLNENPDTINSVKYGYPFTMEKYEDDFSVIVGNKGNYHMDFEGGSMGIYPGRLWLDDKIISFWVYPKKYEISNVLKAIQSSFKTKHNIIIDFNDNWQIEVLKSTDEFDDEIITSIGLDNLYSNQRRNRTYREILVPLSDYDGSLDQPEEKLILHQLNAKRKREELKKMGYKSKTRETSKLSPAAYKDTISKYKFTENFKIFNKLNEYGDAIMFGDNKYNLDDPESFPFIIKDNVVYFGNSANMHWDIKSKYDIDFKIFYSFVEDYDTYETLGRIWIDKKIISFWTIQFDDIKQTLKDIEKSFYNEHNTKINFFDNEWKIDINNKTEIKKLKKYLNKIEHYKYDYYFENEFNYIISLNDYLKYIWDIDTKIELDEDKYKLHQLNAKRKREELKKMGYKSKTRETSKLSPAAYKDTISKYKFTENFKNFNKLNENPNCIEEKGIEWDDEKTFAFGYYFGDFHMDENITHQDIWDDIRINYGDAHYDNQWGRGELAGRLWENEKIISFWYFPENIEELKTVANDIRNYSSINIWNNGWLIEVISDFDRLPIDNIDNWYSDSFLIPVEEYKGSKQRSEEELKINHTDSPQEKERKKQLLKQQGKEITGYFKSKYDVPAKFDYYRRKYMFQENNSGNQQADEFYKNGIKFDYYTTNSFPFSFDGERILFGEEGSTHEESGIYFEGSDIDGRIWVDQKVISFWNLISVNLIKTFKEISNDFYLQERKNINFFDGEWLIVLSDEEDLVFDCVEDFYLNGNTYFLVKLDDYFKGGNIATIKQDEKIRNLHLDKNKREKLLKQGYKSKTKETTKLPPVGYRDMISKYKFTENFNNFKLI